MPRNATVSDDLQPSQLLALNALLAGRSITEAAEQAGVDRGTVHRWLRSDFEFIAAFNSAKQQFIDETTARLASTALRAAETVEQAVSSGNVQAALAVLRGLGLLKGSFFIGSDDPNELQQASEEARRTNDMLRTLSRF